MRRRYVTVFSISSVYFPRQAAPFSGPGDKGPLTGRQILVPPMPSLERRILKRPPKGETDLPGLRAWEPVDCVEVGRRQPCILSAREEHNSRDGRRHMPAQAPQRRGRDLLHGGLVGTTFPAMTMLGLSNIASKADTLLVERMNTVKRTTLVTSSQRSIACVPLISTSGSTIGTSSCS